MTSQPEAIHPPDAPASLAPDIFVARQPILDREQRTSAYELLFRDSASAGGAFIAEAAAATARVAIDTFMTIGTSTVLGECRGFLNVDLEMLASEAVEALPADRIVLEVLESIPAWACDRCLELQSEGFELALDDYVPGDPREPMLGAVDYVKVDLTLTPVAELDGLVRLLRQSGAKLVAEKVETREEFDRCLDLGFDLFQGYYFAKPATLSARRQDPERATLFQAFRALSQEAELSDIEGVFKRNARLGIHLLRLANSAGLGSRQRITTLQHAIMYLGRVQLRRWVLLMLYAGDDRGGAAGALTELAAVRGRLLEVLAGSIHPEPGGRSSKESAFLTGMLSLSHVLLGCDLAELFDELHVDPAIREAVMQRQGALGQLLVAVECLEQGRFAELAELLAAVDISIEQLAEAQIEAYSWMRNISQEMGPSVS